MAHELRQPLSAGLSALRVVQHASDDAVRCRALEIIERQLGRLAKLVDDLTDVASGAEMSTLHRERLDLRRLVQDMVDGVLPQAAERHLHVECHRPKQPLWMHGDRKRLEQVISNLLVNALKYTAGPGRLSVHLERQRDDAVLTISDTGRGMSAGDLPHIFEPFTRGEDVAEHGLGIGLAITRRLVELHGGTIAAASDGPGCGSQFVVTLPIGATHRDRRR